ncbi:hypothetical protein PTI45_04491 [Paenibacillus nuruki]|uniref:Response regulatory domain-containing protein n=1 Tax=Paenibacillus nuruki TaxID=1886670 RepID=A0A1E3KX95_9BACL|nr:response regulator [Paenibacillus nuruki]ODP26169.1 hypothetical protein PTI45_04491 [Paenibacillus nuruki]
MHLLLVEDDDKKANDICRFIDEEYSELINITRKRSWQSGLIEIFDSGEKYKMILLDMSMPRYDPDVGDVNEEFETFAGREFLEEMDRCGIFIPVCIITAFDYFGENENMINYEQLDQNLLKKFSSFYVGMVYFRSSTTNWRQKLKGFLQMEDLK